MMMVNLTIGNITVYPRGSVVKKIEVYKMTNSKMFEEIGCPKQLKKCQAELKRQKNFIQKQSDIILALEKDIELKDNIILVLKNKNG
jgi:hypothetical protein